MPKPEPTPPHPHTASVFTIAPGLPFLRLLARAVLAGGFPCGGGADDLPAMTILVPTRRAARALMEAFLHESTGGATLLPRIRPIGDVEEDELELAPESWAGHADIATLPDAIDPVERHLLLTRRILDWWQPQFQTALGDASAGGRHALNPPQAAQLARELIRLLDAVDIEEAELAAIAGLAPDEFAANWQTTVSFMKLITEWLPDILQARGLVQPMIRRNLLLAQETERLTTKPPDGPVIAAGSTGSIPATARLLSAVARLANGAVVLPGLDLDLDEESWAAVGSAHGHPQYGLYRLLDEIHVARKDVKPLPGSPPTAPRITLLSEAMRPGETTGQWGDAPARLGADGDAAVAGLALVEAPSPHHEALAIAAIMRHRLERPGHEIALVTPDRSLARRVSLILGRWDIAVDDSAGVPLERTVPGAFLRLIGEAARGDFAPVPLLALIKHPLMRLGLAAADIRAMARLIELLCLRGIRPTPGVAGLRLRLEAARAEKPYDETRKRPAKDFDRAERLIGLVEQAFAPLSALAAAPGPVALKALLEAHVQTAEALAARPEQPGGEALWAGAAGEAAATRIAALIAHGEAAPNMGFAHYPAFFDTLLSGVAVRPDGPGHARASIWGALEARLQSADTLILGGLNESTWPRAVEASPWLNRPMQAELGLEPPERRMGLAAHDFVSGAAAPAVFLTRAEKADGAPTVPSRWLRRLMAVAGALGKAGEIDQSRRWLALAETLDRPDAQASARRPAPRPPLRARPRRLSVTRIEALIRDPYALYAQRILNLDPLDEIDAEMSPAMRGQIIHDTLHAFARQTPGPLGADALDRLIDAGRAVFAAHMDQPAVNAFWWPRFKRFAGWFIATEAARRAGRAASASEVPGATEIACAGGPFTLTARADRIDIRADGTLNIIDYKTGAAPNASQVKAGLAPQLPLEAVIARAGGFKGVAGADTSALTYILIRGGAPAGEEKTVAAGDDAMTLTASALDGLRQLISGYDDPDQPYHPRAAVQFARAHYAYDHLARTLEWSVLGDDGGA